ncbi:FdhF/YdeP family oxidoreductase [Pseudomonas sp. CCI3.2]|uniref:FdhF/YdeP family oxidoreductase n=1 Tax=unclassified Pseudomonas TaxID=196821 RepID=UPI002AC9F100|nr:MULTISPECIES: FdhF/YdeP family oxidoreductase [unclassified Pseudomonas]MEB0076579.1 FdhF/YdeP family oxidoreductase [Pseudomonas sp. MH10out]MEB0090494.1 FdhF/YdeP family oxidoreductase [Pseudomonas sp. CCI4.2]MEB0100667.1 FdhF/YdeP family oxidoreductase [Pseudomonas sp. CCI3.2]MEB0123023.1 FdhF/YdeP family oxidoreductase [Pseudomonas sp. CCI1.2]MEB0130282.1 FdhF/YdeP family oxidoreductase [Pseudomonas sp. CCI2.4]
MLIHPKARYKPYESSSGGWGSAKSVMEILWREQALIKAPVALLKQNKPGGFACVSCAWAKPGKPHHLEFCENGAKATAWELTSLKTSPAFFQRHTVSELLQWPDYDLEQHGRLTHPLRYDRASDKYLETTWEEAYRDIGTQLRAMEPERVVFYASGRASLETSFMYQLFARAYGNNNLPDSSNMCHESTSVGLQESIGVPVGTVTLADFELTDCIFFFGQNVGSNSPRMLHPLQEARKRDVPIITFNPLRERGLERFVNPQSPAEMLGPESTVISTQYHQVAIGGDSAAVMGIAKALFEMDKAALIRGEPAVIDQGFIAEHTEGFNEFATAARSCEWNVLEARAGLSRSAMEAAATVYARSERTMFVYGMGLTQHRHGVENVQMLVNLLLLRGNIGKPGAGICPVRGHSNVQGQRTVGITEDPKKVPVDKIEALFGFHVPEKKGLCTVDACEGILDGSVHAFIGLGGNFLRAVPDTSRMEPAWQNLQLNVQIATKLNRTHLVTAEQNWLLPCLGRIEIDRQNGKAQAYSTEDSTGCIHGWWGNSEPASEHLRSETAIIAGLALATLSGIERIDWEAWRGDYAQIRSAIGEVYPEIFHDMETRMWEPGGFHRPLPAAERKWKTPSERAQFIVPKSLNENTDVNPGPDRRDVLQLMTLRSNDQFNTTIYGYEDRFRGISGTRNVVFMNRNDVVRLGFIAGDWVMLTTAVELEVIREVGPMQIVAYDIPEGCTAGYYPECNPLVPLWHHAERSKVPAAKSVPITLRKTQPRPEDLERAVPDKDQIQ